MPLPAVRLLAFSALEFMGEDVLPGSAGDEGTAARTSRQHNTIIVAQRNSRLQDSLACVKKHKEEIFCFVRNAPGYTVATAGRFSLIS